MQDHTYDVKNHDGNHTPTDKVEIDIDQESKQIECLDLTMGNSPHKVHDSVNQYLRYFNVFNFSQKVI